ncbi:MAG TPA: alpha/beta fold hydrolase [Methylocella sp.]|nr:alpha/beta fold hydrolase [Methylocella sp.]
MIEEAAGSNTTLLSDKLMEIWQRLLQRSSISPDDDFFDLGGDSLIAARLFLDIEQEIGRSLPITTIYDAPTVAKLVTLIESAAAPRFSPLVLLKEGDLGSPLFIAHGLGGNVMELSALGNRVQSHHAIYAIQAKGLDGESAPFETVEEMGQLYVEAMREVQPHGPYYLAGYSFGGLVALEIAHRLLQAGEKIALLAFLDSYPHRRYWPLISRLTVMRRLTEHRAAVFLKIPLRESGSQVIKRVLSLGKKPGFPAGRSDQNPMNDPSLPLPVRQVFQSAIMAWGRYRPQYYPGKITFLRASASLVYPENPARVWRHLAGEFELHTVPGDHRALVREHAGALAGALSSCLRKAQDRAGGR